MPVRDHIRERKRERERERERERFMLIVMWRGLRFRVLFIFLEPNQSEVMCFAFWKQKTLYESKVNVF